MPKFRERNCQYMNRTKTKIRLTPVCNLNLINFIKKICVRWNMLAWTQHDFMLPIRTRCSFRLARSWCLLLRTRRTSCSIRNERWAGVCLQAYLIQSRLELEILQCYRIFKNRLSGYYDHVGWWTSANSIIEENVWVWADSGLPVDPNMWSPVGRFAGRRDDVCALMYYRSNYRQLYAFHCSLVYHVICEFENPRWLRIMGHHQCCNVWIYWK